jgi:hypothetical protein
MRQRRAQRVQSAYGRGGLPFGAQLQPLAQHHQGDDHGRGLKVKVGQLPRLGRQPQPHRQAPSSRGAHRHQQVHVARARLERVPAAPVKVRAQDKLHRRGQRKLQPGRQHRMHTQRGGQHGQDQRQRQGQAPGHRPKASPGRSRGHVAGQGLLAHAITRLAHRPAHQGRAIHRRLHAHAGRLGGQVHAG